MSLFFKKSSRPPKTGNMGRYVFAGQHAFRGGGSSCAGNVYYALEYFLDMPDEDFFALFSPPAELNDLQIVESTGALSEMVRRGTQLSLDYAKSISASWFGYFWRSILPKNPHEMFEEISTRMEGYETIARLSNKHLCDYRPDFAGTVVKYIFENHISTLNRTGIACGSAMHGTVLFAKKRELDQKIFYYLFDSAPSRSMEENRNCGLLEVHDSVDSLVESMLHRRKYRLMNMTLYTDDYISLETFTLKDSAVPAPFRMAKGAQGG